MIKASAKTADGRHLVVLGLSEGNVQRLKANQPIFFDMATLRIPADETVGQLVIFYEATEAECHQTLAGLIGPKTEVQVQPRGPQEPQ